VRRAAGWRSSPNAASTRRSAACSRARCPQCRREVGEALFEHLEVWMPGESDNFACPACGFEDDINGFVFAQPCAFSDLGFIFNNWPGQYFLRAFLDEFAARLGFPLRVVQVEL
jgi:rubredoxin